MMVKEPKFRPQLMRGNAQEILEENSTSLKERYGEQKKNEFTIEHRQVSILKRTWSILLMVASIWFAMIGLAALLHPSLRAGLFRVFLQFFAEAGLF